MLNIIYRVYTNLLIPFRCIRDKLTIHGGFNLVNKSVVLV
jgi:hypothetical protein